MNMQSLAIAFLAAASVGGVGWVFMSGDGKAESRRSSVVRSEPARARQTEKKTQRSRREQVEGTLKELEARRQKEKHVSLSMRLTQAGLSATPQQFWIASGVLGGVAALLALVMGGGTLSLAGIVMDDRILSVPGLGIGAGLGLPRWILNHLKKRRESKFIKALPDAVDVIVRGIKAGLPLFESLKVVATDSPEPLRGEFRAIIETQAIGMPLGEACTRLYDRIPLPEANFFGIVIAIQQKSGGNLSEALGNLSKVLRERKKMREKIQAMSMEAKASAGIIGSLPPAVMTLVWLTTPQYISLLWTSSTGQFLLVCSACWMSLGILVMKKMINFDF